MNVGLWPDCRHPKSGLRSVGELWSKLELGQGRPALTGGQAGGDCQAAFCRIELGVCFRPTKLVTAENSNQQRQAAMKVTIREWNAVAAWRWDMPDDDVCGICRNPYDSTCSKCKFPGDECPLRMSLSFSRSIFEVMTDTFQCSASATTPFTWYAAY